LGNHQDGIAIVGTSSDNEILSNVIKNNQRIGILMGQFSSSSTISANMVLGNGRDGIRLSDSTGNTISGNVAMGNADAVGGFDLVDNSIGGQPDGTANFWSNNKAKTRSPAGLL